MIQIPYCIFVENFYWKYSDVITVMIYFQESSKSRNYKKVEIRTKHRQRHAKISMILKIQRCETQNLRAEYSRRGDRKWERVSLRNSKRFSPEPRAQSYRHRIILLRARSRAGYRGSSADKTANGLPRRTEPLTKGLLYLCDVVSSRAISRKATISVRSVFSLHLQLTVTFFQKKTGDRSQSRTSLRAPILTKKGQNSVSKGERGALTTFDEILHVVVDVFVVEWNCR